MGSVYIIFNMANKKTIISWAIPLIGTILLGLSTYVLVTIVELQVTIGMITEEIMSIDKQIGRIYNHIDRMTK